MPRITTFYLSAQEKMLERAKRTFESNFDGEIEFIDFCIDEPVISQGAIDTTKRRMPCGILHRTLQAQTLRCL